MNKLDGISFIDIGLLLSKSIETYIDSKHLSLIANDIVDTIMQKNILHHPVLGDYVAIRNIGILFEPALKLNIYAKFKKWANSFTLVLNYDEGIVKENIFYLAGSNKPYHSVNLSDISYKIISHEI